MSRIVKEGIPAGDVQVVYDQFVNSGYMPTFVRTNSDGLNVFIDFVFEPATGAPYECRNWLTQADYDQLVYDLNAAGYTQICANVFNYQRAVYYCALWINQN